MLFLHCHNSLGISEILGDSVRFSERRELGCEAISWVKFDDGILKTGLHGMTI